MEEKKGIRINLITLVFIIMVFLIIIAILVIYICKLNNKIINKTQSTTIDTVKQEVGIKTDKSNKSINGRFTQKRPDAEENFWYDAGEYWFKEDGTVENINSATKNGYYIINDNIISVCFTDVEGKLIEEEVEFIIKDNNTLLLLSYDTEKDNPICYVSGTVFYRQNENNTAEPNSKSNEEDVDISNKKENSINNTEVEERKVESVKSGDIIRPSKIINKTFNTMDKLDEFAYSSWEDGIQINDALSFYSDMFATGDAIWSGLITNYKASSTYKSSDDKYNVKNLESILTDNCWCEGADGDGRGETIEINAFDSCEKVKGDIHSIKDVTDYLLKEHNSEMKYYSEMVKITEESLNNYYHNELNQIAIINGYAKDDDVWKNNNRIKKLKVTIDNEIDCILELDDTKDLQLFDIYYENKTITKEMNLKFEILDIYKGEKYSDTCLTSLYLIGGSNMIWGGR